MLNENMVPVGTRVFAVLSASAEGVKFLGEGVFEGHFVRPDAPTFEEVWNDATLPRPPDMTQERARAIYDANIFFKSPRIRLDNGDVVWGFECWWGEGGLEELHRRFPNRPIEYWRIERNEKGCAIDAKPDVDQSAPVSGVAA